MTSNVLIKIVIDTFDLLINSTFSVLEACKYSGFSIPRFCYHELLSVAGNCRMCLVEIVNVLKPVASCVTPLVDNMEILLDTPLVLKARENVLEALLLNHPLDCPICDQAGECDLQDQVEKFGSDSSRSIFPKRGVENKNFNSLISTIMTRCIHCTRCIRFSSEILGSETLGLLSRGQATEVGNYTSKYLASELIGNIIDLCPVGALTSKVYSFKARPWELRSLESIDLTDSLGSSIYINFKDLNVFRIIPKPNKKLNGNLITDSARYFFDCLNSQRLFSVYSKIVCNDQTHFLACPGLDLEHLNLFKDKSLFLIDGGLDLETINLFKLLSFNRNGAIQIRSVESIYNESNFFCSKFQSHVDSLNSVNLIFFFSSNLKIESAILNSKIRVKFFKEDIQLYKLGNNFVSNFLAPCINLNISFLLNFLEGKNKLLSSLILSSYVPLFILGESLYKRGFTFFFFELLISRISPLAKILNISLNSNSIGLSFGNIEALSKSDLLKMSLVNAINLKENQQLFKYLHHVKEIAWWNTHGPIVFSTISSWLIPILPYLHENGLYINLEQRAQKAPQIFSAVFSSKIRYAFLLKNELLKFINKVNVSTQFFNFYLYMAKQAESFESCKKFSFFFKNFCILISFLPSKLSVEDPFRFSKYTQNSKVLAECSTKTRKYYQNFEVSLKKR